MPDPFSIALGVTTLAQTGFKLVETIYIYTNSVRKADQQLKPVAEYVQITSTAFENIASHLRDAELRPLYKPALLVSVEDALRSCEAVFGTLNAFIEALRRDKDDRNQRSMTTKSKLTWRWKQKELEALQLQLERCKSTVNVLLGTLNLASSSRNGNDISSMKSDLECLMGVAAEAKKKEVQFQSSSTSQSVKSDAVPGPAPKENSRSFSRTSVSILSNDLVAAPQPNRKKLATALDRNLISSDEIQDQHNEPFKFLSSRLEACEVAMDKLSTTLRRTVRKWDRFQEYEKECLLPDFQALEVTIANVTAYERGSNNESETVTSILHRNDIEAENIKWENEIAKQRAAYEKHLRDSFEEMQKLKTDVDEMENSTQGKIQELEQNFSKNRKMYEAQIQETMRILDEMANRTGSQEHQDRVTSGRQRIEQQWDNQHELEHQRDLEKKRTAEWETQIREKDAKIRELNTKVRELYRALIEKPEKVVLDIQCEMTESRHDIANTASARALVEELRGNVESISVGKGWKSPSSPPFDRLARNEDISSRRELSDMTDVDELLKAWTNILD